MSICCSLGRLIPTISKPEMAFFVTLHQDPTSFLQAAGESLRAQEAQTNLILAHAENLVASQTQTSNQEETLDFTPRPQVWICCWTQVIRRVGGRSKSAPQLDFVLSCTSSYMGPHPLFFISLRNNDELSADFLQPRMRDVVDQLTGLYHPATIFSSFGHAPLVRSFTAEWSQRTGVGPIPGGPWYDASLLSYRPEFGTASTSPMLADDRTRFRPAGKQDIRSVAELCRLFSLTSSPYELTEALADYQARHLITSQQVWVCEVLPPSPQAMEGPSGRDINIRGAAEPTIVSICAVTRVTGTVAAITKVFTHPEFRRRGYAYHLLRYVTRHYIQQGKNQLILYVSNDLAHARRVYERAGFSVQPSSLPSDWIEIGFEGATLGYW